jgi:hypothetical protein
MLTARAWLRGYMANLQREADEMLVARSAERAARLTPLHTIIGEWHAHLPPHHRKPYYTTDELAEQFNAAPRLVGEALHKLGWEHKRKWTVGGPSFRYWVPAAPITPPHETAE